MTSPPLFPFSAVGNPSYQPRYINAGSRPPVIARSHPPHNGQCFSRDVIQYAHQLVAIPHCFEAFRAVRITSAISSFWDPYDVHILGVDFLTAVLHCIAELNIKWFAVSWSQSNRARLHNLCSIPETPLPCPANTFTEPERKYWGDGFLWDVISHIRNCLEKVSKEQQEQQEDLRKVQAKKLEQTNQNSNRSVSNTVKSDETPRVSAVRPSMQRRSSTPKTPYKKGKTEKQTPNVRPADVHVTPGKSAKLIIRGGKAAEDLHPRGVGAPAPQAMPPNEQPQIKQAPLPQSVVWNGPPQIDYPHPPQRAPIHFRSVSRGFRQYDRSIVQQHGPTRPNGSATIHNQQFIDYGHAPPYPYEGMLPPTMILPPIPPTREHPGQPLTAAYPVVSSNLVPSRGPGPVSHSRVFSTPRPENNFQGMIPNSTQMEPMHNPDFGIIGLQQYLPHPAPPIMSGVQPMQFDHRMGRHGQGFSGRGRGRRFSFDRGGRFQGRQSFSGHGYETQPFPPNPNPPHHTKQDTEPFPDFGATAPTSLPTKHFIPFDREDIRQIWFSGFGDDVSERDIRAFFENRDPSLAVCSVSNPGKTSANFNFCFVEFYRVTEARLALELHGQYLKNLQVTIHVPEKFVNPDGRKIRGRSFGADRRPSYARRSSGAHVENGWKPRVSSIQHNYPRQTPMEPLNQAPAATVIQVGSIQYSPQDARSNVDKRLSHHTKLTHANSDDGEDRSSETTVITKHHSHHKKNSKNGFSNVEQNIATKSDSIESQPTRVSGAEKSSNVSESSATTVIRGGDGARDPKPVMNEQRTSRKSPKKKQKAAYIRKSTELDLSMPEPPLSAPALLQHFPSVVLLDKNESKSGLTTKAQQEQTVTVKEMVEPEEKNLVSAPAADHNLPSEQSVARNKTCSPGLTSPAKVAVPSLPTNAAQQSPSSVGTDSPASKSPAIIIEASTVDSSTLEVNISASPEEKVEATEVTFPTSSEAQGRSKPVGLNIKTTGPKQVESLHPFARQKLQKKSTVAKSKRGELKRPKYSSSTAVNGNDLTEIVKTPRGAQYRSVSGKTDNTIDSSPGEQFHDARETLTPFDTEFSPSKKAFAEHEVSNEAVACDDVAESESNSDAQSKTIMVSEEDKAQESVISLPSPLREVSLNTPPPEGLPAEKTSEECVDQVVSPQTLTGKFDASLSPGTSSQGATTMAGTDSAMVTETVESAPKKKPKKKKPKAKKKKATASEEQESNSCDAALEVGDYPAVTIAKVRPGDMVITLEPESGDSTHVPVLTTVSDPNALLAMINDPQSQRHAIEQWAERSGQGGRAGKGRGAEKPRWVSEVLEYTRKGEEVAVREAQMLNVRHLIDQAQLRAQQINGPEMSGPGATMGREMDILQQVQEINDMAANPIPLCSPYEEGRFTLLAKSPESTTSSTIPDDELPQRCATFNTNADVTSPFELASPVDASLELRPLLTSEQSEDPANSLGGGQNRAGRKMSYAETLKALPK